MRFPAREHFLEIGRSGGWSLEVGIYQLDDAADLSAAASSSFVDDALGYYRIYEQGEQVRQSGYGPDFIRWVVAVAGYDVPRDLQAIVQKLPDDPSEYLAKSGRKVRTRSTVPDSEPVAAVFLRPDGREWSAVEVDEVLGGSSLSHSIYSDDYAGVVCHIKPRSRLVVNRSLRSYVVQSRVLLNGANHWDSKKGGRSFTRSRLLETCQIKGVKKALRDLPENPADALPSFSLFCSAQAAAFAMTDWRRDDYRRALARVDDVRLVVDPLGESYVMQRVQEGSWNGFSGSDRWQNLAPFRSGRKLADWLAVQDVFPAPDAFIKALGSLVEDPRDGEWPDLPVRPETVPHGD